MKIFYYLITLFFIASCDANIVVPEKGVSRELATMRSYNFKDVNYNLHFNLPKEIDKQVSGEVEITFKALKKRPIIIDFFAPVDNIKKVVVNGKKCEYIAKNQHITISQEDCIKGMNSVKIEFISPDMSLNRRKEFMYTLLVPDRARTLFPLFDQPDIKATYTLSLTIPNGWSAIANSGEKSVSEVNGDYKEIIFNKSEPISSYLFSFVAGEFEYVSKSRNGREHRIYHREKDKNNLAQMDDIFKELFLSLDYLEEYTAVEYPFSKYDMVLVPGFQYGGMEHIGATIYNAATMFLSPTPTINERISRAKLVAHETAHMWFGDYVTMEWFDDVWTKEVFANYFAAKIMANYFKNTDEKQGMLNYFSHAYSEDRTVGGTSIKQELDNLQYAGLVYNSIIYNKSPLVLNMIAEKLGDIPFRDAIREVLKKYNFGSASWEDWVEIFDKHSPEDITSWSRSWMYESGMPHIDITNKGKKITITQTDIKERGITWEQKIAFRVIDESGNSKEYKTNLKGDSASIIVDFIPKYIIPNSDGNGYGYFRMSKPSVEYIMGKFSAIDSDIEKRMALINLYDNVLQNDEITAKDFINQMLPSLSKENNQLIYSTMLQYISSIYKTYLKPLHGNDTYESMGLKIEKTLWDIFNNSKNTGIKAVTFKQIYALMISDFSAQRMYDYWSGDKKVNGITIGTRDFFDMSLRLALHYPNRADYIVAEQLKKIENKDAKEEYIFVSKAVSPDVMLRDNFFMSLTKRENREIENWVQKALAYLTIEREGGNSRNNYITPALELLPEIQKTGDIFFPQQWSNALLKGNNSREAFDKVGAFIKANPDIHPMLKSKLLIAADHLYRIYDNN